MTRRRVLPIALAVATLAGTASVTVAASPAEQRTAAAPGSDAKVVVASFTVGADQVGSGIATCPEGTRAVGGGVDQRIAPGTEGGTILESGPVDANRSPATTVTGEVARAWLAAGTAGDWRVFAICSATSDATVQATTFRRSPGAGDPFGRGTATCAPGTRVVGGGVVRVTPLVGGDSGLLGPNVVTSEPLDQTGLTAGTETGTVARSWAASVLLSSADAALEYRVIAVCSANSDATIQSQRVTVQDCVGCGKATVVTCPAGKRALGGGVGLIGPAGGFGRLFQSAPADGTGDTAETGSGDVPRSWSAHVNHFAGGDDVEYRVSAICASDATPTAPVSRARCAGLPATIVGTPGQDALRGTPRRDVIAGLGGNDTIRGLAGDDVVCGGGGNDRIDGGAGNDRIAGGAGNDALVGGPGNDTLTGGAGIDSLDGGPGRNTVKP